jgi:hypothetical protein
MAVGCLFHSDGAGWPLFWAENLEAMSCHKHFGKQNARNCVQPINAFRTFAPKEQL